MTYLEKMIENRSVLVKEYETQLESAKTEQRSLTDVETKSLGEIKAKITAIDESIEAEKRSIELKEKSFEVPKVKEAKVESDEKRSFDVYLKTGKIEQRTTDPLNTSQDAAIAPSYFSTDVISETKNMTKLYPMVKEIVVNNANVVIPFFTDYSDAAFTTELQDTDTATDTTGKFGKVEVAPLPLVKRVSVSELLLRTSSINVEAHVKDALVKMYSRVIDNFICNGTGDAQPLGLFKDTNISSINTAGTAIHPDDLKNLVYEMLGKFDANQLALIINPVVFKTAATTKADAYLIGQWMNTLAVEGVKIILSGFAPSTITAESPIAVVGKLDSYGIGRVDALEINREANLKKNLVDFYGRLYINGKTINAGDFKVLKVKPVTTG